MGELQCGGRWWPGGPGGGLTPALALPGYGVPPPGASWQARVMTKMSDPWMPEKATAKTESWLQKSGSLVPGFHASLSCTARQAQTTGPLHVWLSLHQSPFPRY